MRIVNVEITSHDENLQLEVSATTETGQRFSTFMAMPQRVDDLPTALRFAGAQIRNSILDAEQNERS